MSGVFDPMLVPPGGGSAGHPWGSNEYVDHVCVLLNGQGERCAACKRVAFNRYLDEQQRCPDCRSDK